MRRQHWVTWLMAACMCLMTAHLASAQSGTATLQGKVIDAQKMALPGANVTLANPATGFSRTIQSDTSGAFAFPSVPPGTYALTVEMQGFKTSVVDKVALQVDSTSELSIDLQIGSLSESVQVSADAPVINTSDASIGNVMGGDTIRSLPLEGRNVAALLSLQPGVTYVPKADPGATMDPRYGSVSGARADQSTVTLDGIDVNDSDRQTAFTSVLRVTLDSVAGVPRHDQQLRRRVGTLERRAGVARHPQRHERALRLGLLREPQHDVLVERVLPQAVAARGTATQSEAPKLDKHIFGGSIGGPIRKDRLFFFGNFEGLNESRETVVTRAVPSNSLRDGVLIYQCATPSACPGGSVQGVDRHAQRAGRLVRPHPGGTGPGRSAAHRAERRGDELLPGLPVAEPGRTVSRQHRRLPLRRAGREHVPHLHRPRRLSPERQPQLLRPLQQAGRRHRQHAAVSRRGGRAARAATRTGAGRSGGTRPSAATW